MGPSSEIPESRNYPVLMKTTSTSDRGLGIVLIFFAHLLPDMVYYPLAVPG